MRRSGILIWSIVVAVVLGSVAVAVAASPDSGPDPAVKQWPHWTGRASCDGGIPFSPLVSFARPTGVERGSGPPEIALREFLEDPRLAYLGARNHGWRILSASSDHVEFANGNLAVDGTVQIADVAHRRRGWKWVGWDGGCTPTAVQGHRQATTWRLSPGQNLGAETRTVKVDLDAPGCTQGMADERLEAPAFREEGGALLMTLWSEPVPPAELCGELFEPPVTIRLPHRLGRLRLLDGGVFPPRLQR